MFRKLTLRLLTLFVLSASISQALAQEPIQVIHGENLEAPWLNDAKSDQAIHEALNNRVTFNYDNTPLFEVINDLKQKVEIDIQIDLLALDDVGLSIDSPVLLKLKDVRLQTGLRLLLRELDLTTDIEDGSLVVTTPEEAEGNLKTVYYNVSELIRYKPEDDPDFDAIDGLILTTVQPESWGEGKYFNSIVENGIVISQTLDIHEEVEALLAGLRKAKSLPNNQYDVTPIDCSGRDLGEVDLARKRLNEQIDFEVKNKTLEHTLSLLLQEKGVRFKIDRRALEDIGLAPPLIVNGSWKSLYVFQILKQLLNQHDLTYYQSDDVILITTKEEAETDQVVKVYPVRDLQLESRWRNQGFYYYNLPLRYPPTVLDYDQIIQAITSEIEPHSWEEQGGPGAISPFDISGCLVIAQTEVVHQKIEQLLNQIRAKRKRTPIDKPWLLRSGQPITETYRVDGLFASKKDVSLEQQQKALQQVANLIQKEVAPDTWSEKPLYVEVIGDQLVITQLPQVHVEIGKYLIESGLARNRSYDNKPLKPFGVNPSEKQEESKGDDQSEPAPAGSGAAGGIF